MSEAVELARLTRPVIGLENRTPLEVFDIMCDRIRLASLTGEGEPVAWRYRFVVDRDGGLSDWFVVEDAASIPTRQQQTVQPLYTRPQPAAWPDREAVIACIRDAADRGFEAGREGNIHFRFADIIARADALLSASDGAVSLFPQGETE